ncbi:HAD hydrolase-like protein, partial [Candidatus Saccharibacteria bacterium]|nr:HAD hydrolase-like protein [Candidatus Saccharibacteria bacterium]NIV72936.1 HAD hydrolase-like protein [Calditrichia bacterium]NIW80527.1 HAD hydrolase-like protein [Calditrichia bacterium]
EQPGHCLMIGDDPVNDMIAAKIGMKTFLVNKSSPIDQPSLSISQELRDHTDVDVPPPDFE